MIDFENATFFKLKSVPDTTYESLVSRILAENETIQLTFQGIRDGVVFTDKRIIAINVQGITGKKKDITSLPYSKIQAFSVETAGTLDNDSELDLWFSGLGKVRFEFNIDVKVAPICKLISTYVL